MNRVANIALAALAVLVVAAAVYVVTHNKAPAASLATGNVVPQQGGAASAPGASSSDTSGGPGTGTATATARPLVAFIGDDWTFGTGASLRVKRFTTLLAHQLDVRERNFGAEGTGYDMTSGAGGTYAQRVGQVAAAQPSVVVVSGGRNDRSDDPATVADAARQLFTLLHRRLPKAVLIAIAPFWGDSDLPPELATLASSVKTAVTNAGGTYLDVADPIHNHPEFMADGADPNDQGYAAIAAALKPQLKPLIPAA